MEIVHGIQQNTQRVLGYGTKIGNYCVTNIDNNYRFYDVKLIIELLSGYPSFLERYQYTKNSPMALMFLIASVVPELLYDTEAVPISYRRFITRMYTYNRNPDELMDPTKGFCQQVHDKSNCSHSVVECMKTNMMMFEKNCLSLSKLYAKIYIVPLIMGLWHKHGALHCVKSYISSVARSVLSLSSFYLFMHTYLTFIDRHENPKKIHYHFGLFIGTLCLVLGEKKNRSASICQFMIALYVNMWFEKSTKKHKLVWKTLFPILTLLSLRQRGMGKTMMSMI